MPTYNGKVTGGSLRLRSNPNTTGTILTSIPSDTELTVSTITNNQQWFTTTYKGLNGFVMSRWIAITQNSLPTAIVVSPEQLISLYSTSILSKFMVKWYKENH